MNKPKIGVVMGSDSDMPVMEESIKILEKFAIPYEVSVASAHRTPKRVKDYAETASNRGLAVIIAGAGGSAHLAGVIASETVLPVIGVPIDSSPLNGIDSLLSTVQMPGGVPVAAMSIGKAGAKNAAIFALEILAVQDKELENKLKAFRSEMEQKVSKANKKIQTNVDT